MDTLSHLLDNITGLLFFGFGLPVLLCWIALSTRMWGALTPRQKAWTLGLYASGIIASLLFISADLHQFFGWWID